ncbi:MAG TPA: hypothetical protein VGV69_01700 [Solirubrobacterales bacterium]|nr:hypothetical protein [Solirubrobacterales bacterium]
MRAMPLARRHRARSSARPAFALLSVLAVLAMACFPGLAQAEESGEIQYETDVPTVPNNESSNNSSKQDSGNTQTDDESDPEAGGSTAPGGGGSGGSDDPSTGGGAHQGQTNQGSGGDDGQAPNGSKPAGGDVGQAKSIDVAPVADTSAAADDGGSSPLVPILIAIAVLAAISIGAFFYRQRREDDTGSPVSSKAS